MSHPSKKPPSWLKGRDPRDLNLRAQWSEDWTAYHLDGLRLILRSGRFHPKVFVAGGVQELSAESILERPLQWADFLAGRLLAGVGSEFLLKGLYLKHGYSIRDPGRRPLAKRTPQEDRLHNPFKSVSFSEALNARNLRLIDGSDLKALHVAQEWRNSAAHVVTNSFVDSGVHLVGFATVLFALHKRLLDGAGENHYSDVDGVFSVTDPAFTRVSF